MKNKLNKQDKHIVKELIKNYISYSYLPLKIKDTFLKEVYNNYLEKYKDNLTILIDSNSSILDKEVIKDCLNDDQKYYLDSIKFSDNILYNSNNWVIAFDKLDNLIIYSKKNIDSRFIKGIDQVLSNLKYLGFLKKYCYNENKEILKDKYINYSLNDLIKKHTYTSKDLIDSLLNNYFYY